MVVPPLLEHVRCIVDRRRGFPGNSKPFGGGTFVGSGNGATAAGLGVIDTGAGAGSRRAWVATRSGWGAAESALVGAVASVGTEATVANVGVTSIGCCPGAGEPATTGTGIATDCGTATSPEGFRVSEAEVPKIKATTKAAPTTEMIPAVIL